jgi:acetyl esterase
MPPSPAATGEFPATVAGHYVDPDMRPVLERMVARMAERPTMGTAAPADMRARFNEDVLSWNLDPPPVARIENLFVPLPARRVPVRLYDASPSGTPKGALIFFHGGGWVVGDLDSNERAMRLLAIHSDVIVVSVDYCLAPEHRFPQPLDECVAVTRWIHAHAGDWGIDGARLAVGGDSAGGNLALATALDLRNAGERWLRYMLLLYGAFGRDLDSESYRLFGTGEFGLGTDAMKALWAMYLSSPADAADPRAVPLRADLAGLPPALLIAGGLDPLRDDSRQMASRLIAAGGHVDYREYPGVIHGFMSMTRDLAITRRATAHAAHSLQRALGASTAAD